MHNTKPFILLPFVRITSTSIADAAAAAPAAAAVGASMIWRVCLPHRGMTGAYAGIHTPI